MPILTKRKIKSDYICLTIRKAVQDKLLDFYDRFELPQYYALVLSKVMLDKAFESEFISPFIGYDSTDDFTQSLVDKTIEYTEHLDSQDKLQEIIIEYLVHQVIDI